MRKLTVVAFTSVDGVVQGPGGSDEDRDGGFEHGGWLVPYVDEQFMARVSEGVERLSALLLGRRTYQIFASSWPLTGPDDPIGSKLNAVPKYVASRTLDTVSWQNSTLLEGDTVAAVRRLKDGEGGEIQVHGSGGLVQTLVEHDLVDEFHLMVAPALVGSGKRLFGRGTVPGGLQLVDSVATGSGVLMCRYARAGKLEYGAIGPETGNW